MIVIAYSLELHGWVLYDLYTQVVCQGPYSDHADAIEAVKTRAYRLAQGWAP